MNTRVMMGHALAVIAASAAGTVGGLIHTTSTIFAALIRSPRRLR